MRWKSVHELYIAVQHNAHWFSGGIVCAKFICFRFHHYLWDCIWLWIGLSHIVTAVMLFLTNCCFFWRWRWRWLNRYYKKRTILYFSNTHVVHKSLLYVCYTFAICLLYVCYVAYTLLLNIFSHLSSGFYFLFSILSHLSNHKTHL